MTVLYPQGKLLPDHMEKGEIGASSLGSVYFTGSAYRFEHSAGPAMIDMDNGEPYPDSYYDANLLINGKVTKTANLLVGSRIS